MDIDSKSLFANSYFQALEEIGKNLPPEHSHGEQYEIVSKVAYLIGVGKIFFEKEHEPPKIDIYEKLEKEKKARIIRNLCKLRTQLEINFLRVCHGIQREGRSMMAMPEYLPTECFEQLDHDGVQIYVQLKEPSKFLFHINRTIKERINNCKDLFPDWINWAYLSDIFIMPDGLTEAGTKAEAQFYYENQKYYPYKQYMNWPADDQGNILWCDEKFVTLLYQWNGDEFTDLSRVSDVSDRTKANIYTFIEDSEKCIFIVDCENSDPYNLCAAIRNLDPEELSKIDKIILFDDVHAASAWEMLASYIDIPVEYVLIERLKDNKSLADVKVVARTCKEFYENKVDSFVLVSSDSDYWGLIEEMPGAHFLIMVEHDKCSHVLKETLVNNGIFYCYIDDFYAGGGDEIKADALKREISHLLGASLDLNLAQLLEDALDRTRIEMSAPEKKKYIKEKLKDRLCVIIDDEGNVGLEIKKK